MFDVAVRHAMYSADPHVKYIIYMRIVLTALTRLTCLAHILTLSSAGRY